jgi:hypothetical protein
MSDLRLGNRFRKKMDRKRHRVGILRLQKTGVTAQTSLFPKAKHDDLVDGMTEAISYLRGVGLAKTDEEAKADENERVTHRPRPRGALYPV